MSKILSVLPSGFAPTNDALADYLHSSADAIRDWPAVRNLHLVVEYEDGSLERYSAGRPCDDARVVGILTIVAQRLASGAKD